MYLSFNHRVSPGGVSTCGIVLMTSAGGGSVVANDDLRSVFLVVDGRRDVVCVVVTSRGFVTSATVSRGIVMTSEVAIAKQHYCETIKDILGIINKSNMISD